MESITDPRVPLQHRRFPKGTMFASGVARLEKARHCPRGLLQTVLPSEQSTSVVPSPTQLLTEQRQSCSKRGEEQNARA